MAAVRAAKGAAAGVVFTAVGDLVCSSDAGRCPPERWLGEYAESSEVNGRRAYHHRSGRRGLALLDVRGGGEGRAGKAALETS